MSMLRKIQRVGKKATKFQYTATFQSVVVEAQRDKWRPTKICVAWSRRGRRLITMSRPWQPSPDNKMRGVVIWPEPEDMEITVTLYKGPKDKSYETKEWEFSVIDLDGSGRRRVLATTSINMVRYASSLPYEHSLHLKLKPVSRKIKTVILEVLLTSEFLKEGKATDDDMMSIASMMSISNLSTIGFLEDDEDDEYTWNARGSSSPPVVPDHIHSTDELLKWAQEVTESYAGIKITNMTKSWRNGMGFLAIIHYYRPDMLDFEALSPNCIKENNRLAFEIARELGISCPLTANIMVTSTVPDKLLVTSFVYQMNQYFTKATPSAIMKDTGEEGDPSSSSPTASGPQSPTEGSDAKISPTTFDAKPFQKFFKNLSPDTNKVLHYSRRCSQPDTLVQDTPHPLDEALISSQTATDQLSVDDTAAKNQRLRVQRSAPNILESSPPVSPDGVGGTEHVLSPVSETSEPLHEVEFAKVVTTKFKMEPESEERKDDVVQAGVNGSSGSGGGMPSGEDDRAVEFEGDTSSSEQQSSSSVSLLEEGEGEELRPFGGGFQATCGTAGETITSRQRPEATPPKSHRKLPPIPAVLEELPGPLAEPMAREERRRLVRDLIKKARLERCSLDSITPLKTGDPKKNYREIAKQMLTDALNTPRTQKRLEVLEQEDDSLLSESSSTSLSTADEVSPMLHHKETLAATAEVAPDNANTNKVISEEATSGKISLEDLMSEGGVKRERSESMPAASGAKLRDEVAPTVPPTAEGVPTSPPQVINGLETERKAERKIRKLPPSPLGESKVRSGDSPGQNKQTRRSSVESKEGETRQPRRSSVENKDASSTTPRSLPRRSSEGAGLNALKSASSSRIETRPVPKQLGKQQASTGSVPERGRELQKDSVQSTNKHEKTTENPGNGVIKNRTVKSLRQMDRPKSARVASTRARTVVARPPSASHKMEKPKPVVSKAPSKGVLELKLKREQQQQQQQSSSEMDGSEVAAENGTSEEGHENGGSGVELDVDTTHSETEARIKKNSLQSPSAWSQHSEDLSNDILVTQSEYVRGELVTLRTQLQTLEARATNIEADIRNAMSEGNKEEEEVLMREWFSVLNRKNDFIKRQMELQILEKEEDLEKKQFFINRELRPLMNKTEEEKSVEQKQREEQLLKQLLELIDERDKLERRKMANTSKSNEERAALEAAAMADGNPQQQQQQQQQRHPSKDCVIS